MIRLRYHPTGTQPKLGDLIRNHANGNLRRVIGELPAAGHSLLIMESAGHHKAGRITPPRQVRLSTLRSYPGGDIITGGWAHQAHRLVTPYTV